MTLGTISSSTGFKESEGLKRFKRFRRFKGFKRFDEAG